MNDAYIFTHCEEWTLAYYCWVWCTWPLTTPVAMIGSMQLDWRFLLSFSASMVFMVSTLFMKSCCAFIGPRFNDWDESSRSFKLGILSSLICMFASLIVRFTMFIIKKGRNSYSVNQGVHLLRSICSRSRPCLPLGRLWQYYFQRSKQES